MVCGALSRKGEKTLSPKGEVSAKPTERDVAHEPAAVSTSEWTSPSGPPGHLPLQGEGL